MATKPFGTIYLILNMVEPNKPSSSVLVIMDGGAGRFVHGLRAFAALRMHHESARITAMLDTKLQGFASLAPYFDEVVPLPGTAMALARELAHHSWGDIYDFMGGSQSKWASRLSRWFFRSARGTAGASWIGPLADTKSAHESERFLTQIDQAGVQERPPVSLAWVSRAANAYSVPLALGEPFVLLAVDVAEHQTGWDEEGLAQCCELIRAKGHRPVLIGAQEPAQTTEAITDMVPDLVNMIGSATQEEIVFMSWAAAGAIGYVNDIMHLVSASGCKSVLLYDSHSDAAQYGHLGPDVTILRRHAIEAISPVEAVQALYQEAVA